LAAKSANTEVYVCMNDPVCLTQQLAMEAPSLVLKMMLLNNWTVCGEPCRCLLLVVEQRYSQRG